MKHGPIAFLAALLLSGAVSCERIPESRMQEVRFLALPAETRTAFTAPEDGVYPVIWTSGDRNVKISLDAGTSVQAAVRPAADGKSARFTATFPAIGSGSHTFCALSPASAYAGITDGQWSWSVPTTQSPTATSVDPAAMVLSASATTDGPPEEVQLHFTHLTAYGCFSLQGLDASIQSVSLDFGGEDALTLQTSSSEDIWFGIKPLDVSGKELGIRVKTDAGTYSRSITFPEGKAFEAGKIARFAVDMSDAAFDPIRSVSILAIGNSFSVDAMQYLYGYLKQAGYEEIFLGNLYIGGCSLEKHAGNITGGTAAYTYYTNSKGTWSTVNSQDAVSAMKSRKWDYVSMQQASDWSGVPDSYEPYLSTIVDAVKTHCPEAKRMWHMTWAYQANSTHGSFPKYGCVQIRMYNAIVDAVRTRVLSRGDFDFVIPCGTAIQNLRTSFIGDTVTRDGYHMSYDIGRVATALMWLKQIDGGPLEGIDIKPAGYSQTQQQAAAIKDAVEKAYTKPLEVTESAYPPDLTWHESDPALQQVLSGAGYDPARYRELPYSLTLHAFYNSTGGSGLTTTASNSDEFAATQFFSKETLPVGSVLVLKEGYQYRPEKWTRLSAKTSDRPGQTQVQVFAITESWWSGSAYRAFNLSKAGNPHLTDAEMQSLRSCLSIFVPVD